MVAKLSSMVFTVVLAVVAMPMAATAATAGTAGTTTTCPLPVYGPGSSYHPVIDAASFTADVDNPFFPLVPGQTLVYTGTKDGKPALDVVVTTARTRVVDGVTTRVVEDRLYLANRLEERTSDYYAQDRCGNVWYFGEDTATLDRRGRVVSTEGSFHAGIDGAQPGVFMQAAPEIGRRFRQEWYEGHAEDTFSALSTSASVTVPAGSFDQVLRTRETTALEPDVRDNKYFVRGIGEVREVAVRGPVERLDLVEVIS
jgi:hypothetical protein